MQQERRHKTAASRDENDLCAESCHEIVDEGSRMAAA